MFSSPEKTLNSAKAILYLCYGQAFFKKQDPLKVLYKYASGCFRYLHTSFDNICQVFEISFLESFFGYCLLVPDVQHANLILNCFSC